MEARLALRTSEERARALHGRADQLVRAAAAEREARAKAAERRERLIREGRAADAVVAASRVVLARLDRSVDLATAARTEVEQGRAGREQELLSVRSALRDLAREHDELVNSVHRDEMARTQQRMRIEQLEERALEELGLEPDGPAGRLRPRPAGPVHRRRRPRARSRPHRCRSSARSSRSGCAPPSATSRCSAGSTRSRSRSSPRWRSGTSSSASSSRTCARPARTCSTSSARSTPGSQEVFTEAYADVSRAFDETFARLFPGGEGRLVLTDPDDMLATGVEVEARPPGKKIKRLSLLSGGERSLVAVAFLVALFKARPSPFYILDEVEAALDDTNLGRLLEIYEELRENSQLLVITHQKRTMEVGDALYGVTMRGDGVSAVICQRLRDIRLPRRGFSRMGVAACCARVESAP